MPASKRDVDGREVSPAAAAQTGAEPPCADAAAAPCASGTDIRERLARSGGYVYFGSASRGDMKLLSNLCMLDRPIDHGGLKFSSVEAAYQSAKTMDPEHYAVGGVLDDPAAGFEIAFGARDAAKKRDHYMGKAGVATPHYGMVGIIAKVVNTQLMNAKGGKLPLGTGLGFVHNTGAMSPEESEALMRKLLAAKYTANELHREALLSTGDKLLVEFSRSAKRQETATGIPPTWTGLVDAVNGRLYGRNRMGELLMEIRESLRQKL